MARKTKRQRPHGALPAGLQWRDGRPRWIPSPTRRGQGWKGVDLRDGHRGWLAKGPAVARAEAIAAAVAGWAKGEAVPAAFLHFAPKGSDIKGAEAADLNPRSVGALLDGYMASPNYLRLAKATQDDYRWKISRVLQVVAARRDPAFLLPTGSAEAVAKAKASLAKKVAALRGVDIDFFVPPAFGEAGDDELQETYEWMRDHIGATMAVSSMRSMSAWFRWCWKKKRVWPSNPAALLEMDELPGRIRVASWDELKALVKGAHAAGLPSMADAIVMAVDLSWSRQDMVALSWGQIAVDGRVKHRRIKTGIAANPPLLPLGQAVVARRIAELPAGESRPVGAVPVFVSERTGEAYSVGHFTKMFAEARAEAVKLQPSVADFQFRDLRDTAITYMIDAGLDREQRCSRSAHSTARDGAVERKHYGQIRQGVAEAAAEKLAAHFAEMGYVLEERLALPAPGA